MSNIIKVINFYIQLMVPLHIISTEGLELRTTIKGFRLDGL
jgi:hypothetical protein